jgi:transcriptional regulator NrdR family protein
MKVTRFECPACNYAPTKVVLTKTTEQGVTLRRRVCQACGHRWYTSQYPEATLTQKIKWRKNGKALDFLD